MKASTVVLLLIVVGYLAFEVHVVSRNAYRTEPGFIFNRYVEASRAVGRCGPLKAADTAQFEANYRYARWRAANVLGDDAPTADPESLLQAREAEGRRRIDQLLADLGCEDVELFKLRKRHQVLARRKLRIPEDARGDRVGPGG